MFHFTLMRCKQLTFLVLLKPLSCKQSSFWGLQESDEWAEDQTNKASLDPSIKVARERGDPGTKGQTGDLHVSAALRNLLRTSLRQEESSLQTSEFV